MCYALYMGLPACSPPFRVMGAPQVRDAAVDAFGTEAAANAADVHNVVHLLKHENSEVRGHWGV